jgi:hypothetical protein
MECPSLQMPPIYCSWSYNGSKHEVIILIIRARSLERAQTQTHTHNYDAIEYVYVHMCISERYLAESIYLEEAFSFTGCSVVYNPRTIWGGTMNAKRLLPSGSTSSAHLRGADLQEKNKPPHTSPATDDLRIGCWLAGKRAIDGNRISMRRTNPHTHIPTAAGEISYICVLDTS